MITFPESFAKVPRFPGYFWDTKEKRLWTIKGGCLKPMKLKKAWRNHPEHYTLSRNGIRFNRYLSSFDKITTKDIQMVDFCRDA